MRRRIANCLGVFVLFSCQIVFAFQPARLDRLKVPSDFVIEQIVRPGLVKHPMSVCFDDRGRMFVTEAAGLNLPFKELEAKLPNSIKLLEDTDGDGVFDKVSVFADKMTFPGGVLWHDGALYATSPPYLWKLEDTDGDGKADKRTPLVGKFGSTGNGADLHGPFMGPDGLLYFCDGRNGHDIQTKDGVKMKGRAAGVYRCRTDGTGLERICSGGMDNPVEVAFSPAGEPFVCTNIVGTNPRRDAILYAIDGGVYPHDAMAIAELRGTGELLPINGDLGWCAVSSLIRYRGTHLGSNFLESFFTTQFNTHKVQFHWCTRDGAGFDWKHWDFLKTDDSDFHPTCVREHPDGSLIVVDTGGWFRIGCPASQLAKPEIPGGVYRIRHRTNPILVDALGLKMDWKNQTFGELLNRLSDPRFTVRDRAAFEMQRLTTMPPKVLARNDLLDSGGLEKSSGPEIVWAFARAKNDSAWKELMRRPSLMPMAGLESSRQAWFVAASVFRKADILEPQTVPGRIPEGPLDWTINSPLQWMNKTRAQSRQQAILLARINASQHRLRGITESFEGIREDPMLWHAQVYSSLERKDVGIVRCMDGRAPDKWWPSRRSLVVLDILDHANLTPELLMRALDAGDLRVRETALQIVLRKPKFANEARALVANQLQSKTTYSLNEQQAAMLVGFAPDPGIQRIMAEQWRNYRSARNKVLSIIDAATQIPTAKWEPELHEAIANLLQVEDQEIVGAALLALPNDRIAANVESLQRIAVRESWDMEIRLRALRSAAKALPVLDDRLLSICLHCLSQHEFPVLRHLAVESLANAKLDNKQLAIIVPSVTKAGAFDLPILLKAFEGRNDESLGGQLVTALEKSPGWRSISTESLRQVLAKYPESVREKAKPLFAKMAAESAKMSEKIAGVEAMLATGNVDRGRMVFFSTKSACSNCHKAERQGSDIGPDLSKIGGIRAGRDLIESIVFPSLSIVRGYEPYSIVLKDGSVIGGIIRQETPSTYHIVLADRTIRKIPRGQIEQLTPSPTSIMPQGFDGQLSAKELADLVCFLRSLK